MAAMKITMSWTKSYCYVSKKLSKNSDKPNTKIFEQYNYIHDTWQRASSGVSSLIRKNIPQNKINIHTHF